MAGKFSHMLGTIKQVGIKVAKWGAIAGMVVGAFGIVLAALTGTGILAATGLAIGYALNGAIVGGILGAAFGVFKGLVTRPEPSVPAAQPEMAPAPAAPVQQPVVAPAIAAPAPVVAPVPQAVNGGPAQAAAVLDRAKQLQDLTASLSDQLQACGVGGGAVAANPGKPGNWQQGAAAAPSNGQTR